MPKKSRGEFFTPEEWVAYRVNQLRILQGVAKERNALLKFVRGCYANSYRCIDHLKSFPLQEDFSCCCSLEARQLREVFRETGLAP